MSRWWRSKIVLRQKKHKPVIWIASYGFRVTLEIADERQQDFLQGLKTAPDLYAGAEIIQGQLSGLKEYVLDRLKPKAPKANDTSSGDTGDHPPTGLSDLRRA